MVNNKKKHSHFESPLRYPGGKACLFPFISKLFYENNLIGIDYAEPYAGGAGLALKLLFNEYVNSIHINDYDIALYSFWKVILESNTRFCDWIEGVEISMDQWHYYRHIQKNPLDYSQFELGQSVFYLNRTNISGILKGGPIGGLKQEGKYKIDARFNKSDLLNRIQRINEFRHRISVTRQDGVMFIDYLNQLSQNTFTYLDPPYVQKGADLYMNFYKKHDHEKLAKKVDMIKGSWLVSYDNNEFILGLYNSRKKLRYRLSQSASNRIGNEILIFSNDMRFSSASLKLKDVTML